MVLARMAAELYFSDARELRAELAGEAVAMARRLEDPATRAYTLNARHGALPQKDFDYYLRERMVFDTAGFCGALGSLRTALVELPASPVWVCA